MKCIFLVPLQQLKQKALGNAENHLLLIQYILENI